MNKFEQIKLDLIDNLSKVKYKGDLSDIGNEIGIIIGKYLSDDELGYDLDDFISGLEHGISLIDGTHG